MGSSTAPEWIQRLVDTANPTTTTNLGTASDAGQRIATLAASTAITKPSPPPPMPEDQAHPLFEADRGVVNRLLAADAPADADLVDAARLLMRYEGFPGAIDIKEDLAKAIGLWGMHREALHERTRAI